MTTQITLTFEMRTAPSVEAATQLIEAWFNGHLDLNGGWLRPLKVQSLRIEGEGLAAVEVERLLKNSSGTEIARRRADLGLSQRDLAHRAGLTAAAIGQIERGLIGPTSKSAAAVRHALDAAEAAR